MMGLTGYNGYGEGAEQGNFPMTTSTDVGLRLSTPIFPTFVISKRYILAWMTSLGLAIFFGMRSNLGVAVVETLIEANGTTKAPDFNWNATTVWMIDADFFLGYFVGHLTGGFLASKYSSKILFGTCIAVSAILNLLAPTGVRSKEVLNLIRIIQGVTEGIVYPSLFGLLRWWAPPLERSRMITLSHAGSFVGMIVGLPFAGFLAESVGISVSYYVYGTVGLLWFLLWLWLTAENPSVHGTISQEELVYIEESIGAMETVPGFCRVPWCRMLISMPVWAVVVGSFCMSWMHYTMTYSIPVYARQVLHLKIDQMSFASVFTYPLMLLVFLIPLGGILADHLLQKRNLKRKNVRLILTTLGLGSEATFLFAALHVIDKPIPVFLFLILGQTLSGFAFSGYFVNQLEIAPKYASVVLGISGAVASLAGIICPIVVDKMTQNPTAEEWHAFFFVSGVIALGGVFFFGIFASGEVQSWAIPREESEDATMGDLLCSGVQDFGEHWCFH